MAKRRERPIVNPLLKDRVAAIVEPLERGRAGERAHHAATTPRAHSPARAALSKEKFVHVKARFTPEEAEELARFARTLSSYLRTNVKGSEVTRALWTLALRSQDRLAEMADTLPHLSRPSNGDKLAMAQFEDAIAMVLFKAISQSSNA